MSAELAVKLPEKRAWLHGNLRDNPGVLGLGHCARLERFGDNLRWVLDANHPSSALTNAGSKGAEPALSAQQMLAKAGKLDLVNNVFQNGVHGSLRNTLVEVRHATPHSGLFENFFPQCLRSQIAMKAVLLSP